MLVAKLGMIIMNNLRASEREREKENMQEKERKDGERERKTECAKGRKDDKFSRRKSKI